MAYSAARRRYLTGEARLRGAGWVKTSVGWRRGSQPRQPSVSMVRALVIQDDIDRVEAGRTEGSNQAEDEV